VFVIIVWLIEIKVLTVEVSVYNNILHIINYMYLFIMVFANVLFILLGRARERKRDKEEYINILINILRVYFTFL